MFTYNCPQCQLGLQAQDDWIGRSARCPRCKQVNPVPRPGVATLPDPVYVVPSSAPASPATPTANPHDQHTRSAVTTSDAMKESVSVPGYEILDELGRGGMGVVYKARQTALKRLVALKMILVGQHASGGERVRFRQEAEAIAQLQHPNIVQIYEIGEHQGHPFFSLEFCSGGTLARRIADTLLPPKLAAATVETLARAIHLAHQRGIVHRDLKPANVLLMADGTLKITDFGLAKQLDQSQHTASGAIMGTPAYMAPEQAEGRIKDIGPGTDIYALGSILYELLTGRPPFSGPVQLVLINAIMLDPPAPQSINAGVPPDLETICLKCLQKDAAKRYASAEALADDLRRYLHNEPIQARPVTRGERAWRWARRNPGVAGLLTVLSLFLLTVAVVSTVFALRFDQLASQERETAANERDARAAANLAQEQEATLRKQAETATRESQLQQVRLTAKAGWDRYEEQPSEALPWFVESLRLAQGHPRQEQLARMRLGTLLDLYPPMQLWFGVRFAGFDATGERVVTTSDDGTVCVSDSVTGEPLTPVLLHEQTVLGAAFSPDRKHLATGCLDGRVRIWDLSSGKILKTFSRGDPVWYLRYAPNGQSLITGTSNDRYQAFDLTTDSDRHSNTDQLSVLATSADGLLLVRRATPEKGGNEGSSVTIRLWDTRTGRDLPDKIEAEGPLTLASLSGDNKRLVTVHPGQGQQKLDMEINLWDVTSGKKVATLPLIPADVSCVALNHEGKQVALGTRTGRAELWTESNGKWMVTQHSYSAGVRSVAFSPNDKHLAVSWAGAYYQPQQVIQPRVEEETALPGLVAAPVVEQATKPLEGAGVVVIDTATGVAATPFLKQHLNSDRLQFSADSKRLLVRGGELEEAEACVWTLTSPLPYAKRLPESTGVYEPIWSTDSKTVYGFPIDGAMRLTWGVPSGQLIERGTPGGPVTTRDMTAYKLLAVTKEYEITRLSERGYPVKTRQAITSFEAVAFVQRATGDEKTLNEWEQIEKNRPVLVLPGAVMVNAFNRDSTLVLASDLGMLGGYRSRVWHTATKTPRTAPLVHRDHVSAADFSPDNSVLVTVENFHFVRLWDVASGEPITARLHSPVPLQAVRLAGDSRWLVGVESTVEVVPAPVLPGMTECAPPAPPVAQRDRLWLWDLLAPSERSLEQLRLQAQLLSRHHFDATRTLEPMKPHQQQLTWEQLQWENPPAQARASTSARIGWHRYRLDVCIKSKIWEPAIQHLTQLLELAARDGGENLKGSIAAFHAQRAFARAALGQLEPARQDYQRCADLGTATAKELYHLAVLQLALEQPEEYRKSCQQLREKYAGGDESDVRTAVWTSLLRADGTSDPARLVPLAEKIFERRPNDGMALVTLMAAYYRAGKYQEAIKRLEHAQGGGPDKKWLQLNPEESHFSQMIGALCYPRNGQKEQGASLWATVGRTLVGPDATITSEREGQDAFSWVQRTELKLLAREAQAVLGDPRQFVPAAPPKIDNEKPDAKKPET